MNWRLERQLAKQQTRRTRRAMRGGQGAWDSIRATKERKQDISYFFSFFPLISLGRQSAKPGRLSGPKRQDQVTRRRKPTTEHGRRLAGPYPGIGAGERDRTQPCLSAWDSLSCGARGNVNPKGDPSFPSVSINAAKTRCGQSAPYNSLKWYGELDGHFRFDKSLARLT